MEENIDNITDINITSEDSVEKRKRFANLKLSKAVADKICQELSRGVPIKYACVIAGISRDTYYKWLKAAKELPEDTSKYDEYDELLKYFEKKMEEGKAFAIASRVEHIRLDNSWQSSAWWLERMAHEDFGKKQTIDANVNAKVKTADISKLFDDEKVSKILDEERIDD